MPVDTKSLTLTFEVASTATVGWPISVNVSKIDIVGMPTVKNIYNALDDHGLLLGLPKLPEERNAVYKRRLMDVFAHRANSTYLGLIYGITRELGLSLSQPVAFHPRLDGTGALVGSNPVIELDGPEVSIWADYFNDTSPELIVDRWDLTLEELVAEVNAGSPSIRAHLEIPEAATDRAMTLLNQTNRKLVKAEIVPNSRFIELQHTYVVHSALFTGSDAFLNRVTTQGLLVNEGDYYIDQIQGQVWTVSWPGTTGQIRYEYLEAPLMAFASPVIIHEPYRASFKKKMFEVVTLEDGTTIHGLPTELGADLINEYLSTVPILLGH